MSLTPGGVLQALLGGADEDRGQLAAWPGDRPAGGRAPGRGAGARRHDRGSARARGAPPSRSRCSGIRSGGCWTIRSRAACSPPSAPPAGRARKRECSMSDMEHWLRERKVTEVECLVADLNGIARGKILPAAKFLRSLARTRLRLPEAVFVQTVTGDYPRRGRDRPGVPRHRMRPDPARCGSCPGTTSRPRR